MKKQLTNLHRASLQIAQGSEVIGQSGESKSESNVGEIDVSRRIELKY